MLSLLLTGVAVSAVLQPPAFKAELTAIPSDLNSYSVAMGFLKTGELYVWQNQLTTRHLLLKPETNLLYEISSPSQGKYRVSPSVDDSGELKAVVTRDDGNTAVYHYRNSSWKQVSPPGFPYCDAAFTNKAGDVAAVVKQKAAGPYLCLLIQGGKTINLTESLKKPGLGVSALLDDGRVVLSESKGDDLLFYLYSKGDLKLICQAKNDPGYIYTWRVDRQRAEVLLTSVSSSKPLEPRPTVIYGPNGSRMLKSPAGKDLAHIRLGLNGWYGALEPAPNSDKYSRSVVVIDGISYYLDDLNSNVSDLKTKYRFQGIFTTSPVIGPQGSIAASGPTNLEKGGFVHKYYLLNRVNLN